MTRNPDCLPPTASLRDAMKLMVEHDYRHVPVVEGQRICGVLSARDIYKNSMASIQSGVSSLAREMLSHG